MDTQLQLSIFDDLDADQELMNRAQRILEHQARARLEAEQPCTLCGRKRSDPAECIQTQLRESLAAGTFNGGKKK